MKEWKSYIGGEWTSTGDTREAIRTYDKSPIGKLHLCGPAEMDLAISRATAAFAETNHIYTIVQINAAIAAAPATDDSVCKDFGFRGTGCIAVFTHSDRDDE